MDQIGRYRITGELGRGAMGIVYSALDPTIGRQVAIKTIRLSEFTDPTERARLHERLFREARSAGLLSHPNIVTIYDIAEQDDTAYIAMEYVDGPTLDRLMVDNPPDRDLILSVIRQTAAGLDFAHSKGVVHRDIKPANIMLHEGRTVKITDFGVARLQSQQMTQAGALLGTPNYMSPEQIQGVPVDGRADQFSLGVIAYELLTGERPFAGDSMPTVIYRIAHENPVPPRRLNPSLGWPVDTVLNRVLAKKPDERYASCEEFAAALENACKASGDWRPLAPGAAEAMPTLVENPAQPAEAAAVPEKPIILPPLPPRDLRDEEKPPSAILRAARAAALFVLIAGGLLFAGWAVVQYMDSSDANQTASSKEPQEQPMETPAPVPRPPAAAKPEAKPEPQEEPPAEVKPVPETSSRRTEQPKEPEAPKTMHFITSPPGATVTLENGSTCQTPCDLPATNARHTATVTLEGYRRALRLVEPARDPELVVQLERTVGTLAVGSTPPGASISVNGQPRTEKTPALLRLAPGQYKLEVTLDGRRYAEEVGVKDGVITNVDVSFTR